MRGFLGFIVVDGLAREAEDAVIRRLAEVGQHARTVQARRVPFSDALQHILRAPSASFLCWKRFRVSSKLADADSNNAFERASLAQRKSARAEAIARALGEFFVVRVTTGWHCASVSS